MAEKPALVRLVRALGKPYELRAGLAGEVFRPHLINQRPEDVDFIFENVADQYIGDEPF